MQTSCLLVPQLDAVNAQAFDAFVNASPYQAYQQARAWADVMTRQNGYDFLYFMCWADGRLIGTAVIRRTRLSPWNWLAKVQRGPLVADIADFPFVARSLAEALAGAGACSLLLAPRVRGRDVPVAAETLRLLGAMPLPLRQQSLHVSTGIIWLDKSEDDLMASFKQRGRRQIRLAERAGVTVREASGAADIATYQRLLDSFHERNPSYASAGVPDAQGQADLVAKLGGAMLLAEMNGEPLGGHVYLRQANEAIWLSMPTGLDDPKVPRSYSLLWQAMRLARQQGCIGFDLAGMPLDPMAEPDASGRLQFKSAFSPHRRIMVPMNVIALRPLSHLVLFNARESYRQMRDTYRARRRIAA